MEKHWVGKMKTFNITAKAYDLCSSNPKQSILINDTIKHNDANSAQNLFVSKMLIDDIIIEKILSTEEICQGVA